MLAARRFMLDQQLTCPIVVKPNQGQRGSGVVMARTTEALQDALHQSSVDTIVQEYVGGAEFGVFYYRRPSEPRGHIFSVTEKRFPMVVGDGRRTLEQLILDDERAVCSARLYLERHRERPDDGARPKASRSPLAELGHALPWCALPRRRLDRLACARRPIRGDRSRLRRFLFRPIRCSRGRRHRRVSIRTRVQDYRAQWRHVRGDAHLSPGNAI